MLNSKKVNFLQIIFPASIALLIYLSIANPPEVYQVYKLVPPLSKLVPNSTFVSPMPISFVNVRVKVFAFLAVNYLIITLFGYLLVYPFLSRVGVFPFIQFIASFIAGYICTVPLIRILSLMIPYKHIYIPVIALILACIYFKLFRRQSQVLKLSRLRSPTEVREESFILIFILTILFFSVLLLQVYQVDFKWFGHANVNPFLDEWREKEVTHFPIITQHYEDLIIHYFLSISLNKKMPSVIPWWISLALLKTSLFALLYIIFRKIGAGFYLAIIFCIYFMIGTTSILPSKYYLIFEYGNPAYFIAVSGRVIGIALFIFMITYGAYEAPKNQLPGLYFILLGAGLTSITMPNALWILFFYLLTLISRYYYSHSAVGGGNATVMERFSGRGVIYGSVFISLLLYGLPFDKTPAHFLRFFLVMLIFILLVVHMIPRFVFVFQRRASWPEDLKSRVRIAGLFALSVIVGLVFFGNMLVVNGVSVSTFNILGSIFGNINYDFLQSSYVTFGKFTFGDFRNINSGSEYTKGIMQFTSCYGGILAMILIADYLFARYKKHNNVEAMEHTLYEIFLMSAGLLPILLWFTDFLDIMPVNTWNKTRFIELPIYYIIFYFLFSLARFLSPRAKIIAGMILIIYSVTPFLATERHKQIHENWKFVKYMIKQRN